MKIKALVYILIVFSFLNFAYAEYNISQAKGKEVESNEIDLKALVPDEKQSIAAPAKSVDVGMSEAEQKEKQARMEAGHPLNDKAIREGCAEIPSTLYGFGGSSKYYTAAKNLMASCEKYNSSKGICDKTAFVASNACFAGSSIDLGTVITAVQGLSTVASVSIQDSCSMAAKAMGIIQKGTAAYGMACGATTAACHSKCGTSSVALVEFKRYLAEGDKIVKVKCTFDDLNEAEKAEYAKSTAAYGPIDPKECRTAAEKLEKIIATLQKPVFEELDATDPGAVAGKEKICKIDFNKMILAAGVSAAALVQGYLKADQCSKKTETAQALNCNDPANASVPDCICLKNPRSQGCPNALVKASGTGTAIPSIVNGSSASTLTTKANLAPSGSTVDRDPAGVAQKASAENVGGAQAGAPIGGGGSGSAGATDGKGSGSSEVPGLRSKGGPNTNVMGGYEGGGGSGRGGFRSEQDARNAFANYRKNLNPTKVAAQAWSREVTPQGGRSNFEKVRSRYNDNRRTLKGE